MNTIGQELSKIGGQNLLFCSESTANLSSQLAASLHAYPHAQPMLLLTLLSLCYLSFCSFQCLQWSLSDRPPLCTTFLSSCLLLPPFTLNVAYCISFFNPLLESLYLLHLTILSVPDPLSCLHYCLLNPFLNLAFCPAGRLVCCIR